MRLTICAASLLMVGIAHGQTPRPTELDSVRVEAKALSPRLLEFETRRKAGQGQFMTQAEIETRNSVMTSDVLRAFRYRDGMRCQRRYFVDDVLVNVRSIDDDLPGPKEIAGIEVYDGPANMPLKYKTTNGGGFCGIVLIWTRDGS